MQRQWRIRRQAVAVADGQRRWDRAYQHLLRWTQPCPQPATTACERQTVEVEHARSGLCAGVDTTAGAGADD